MDINKSRVQSGHLPTVCLALVSVIFAVLCQPPTPPGIPGDLFCSDSSITGKERDDNGRLLIM